MGEVDLFWQGETKSFSVPAASKCVCFGWYLSSGCLSECSRTTCSSVIVKRVVTTKSVLAVLYTRHTDFPLNITTCCLVLSSELTFPPPLLSSLFLWTKQVVEKSPSSLAPPRYRFVPKLLARPHKEKNKTAFYMWGRRVRVPGFSCSYRLWFLAAVESQLQLCGVFRKAPVRNE